MKRNRLKTVHDKYTRFEMWHARQTLKNSGGGGGAER